jgi:hypothetical protein
METNSTGIDDKLTTERISDHYERNDGSPSSSKMEPPPLVRNMSAEYRAATELKLKRKIDLRLMPMIILMYIMNYLDRNNIAAVRLAGLQDELDLSSTQYQVCRQEYERDIRGCWS